MKGVKRKAEQPTLAAFGFTKKVIHNEEKSQVQPTAVEID